MRLLVIIPARGGSKRLPMKNKRLLGKLPLISWTIEFAKKLPDVKDILVSTDDPDILSIAKTSGVMVPWLRPLSLSSDSSTSIEVLLHALDWYESNCGLVDGVLMLQATSPFRKFEAAAEGIELFKNNIDCSVIGVSQVRDNPYWMLEKDKEGFVSPLMGVDKFNMHSQLLPNFYIVNGTFYLASPSNLRINNGFISNKTIPLIAKFDEESIDIDYESDWIVAENYLRSLHE